MRKTFLDFVEQNNNINEAFKYDEIDKAMGLILNVLKKHINKIYAMPHGELIKDGSKTLFAKWYLLANAEKSFTINWDQDKNEVYSISFFDKEQTHALLWDKKAKSQNQKTDRRNAQSLRNISPIKICRDIPRS